MGRSANALYQGGSPLLQGAVANRVGARDHHAAVSGRVYHRNRRETPEFGWGAWQIIETGEPTVLAIRYEWESRVVIAVHGNQVLLG